MTDSVDDLNLSPLITAAFDQVAEGVIIADVSGRLVYVNRSAVKLHGVEALDVTPDDYSQTYHLFTMDGAPYPNEELPMFRAVGAGETIIDTHWRIRRPSGDEIIAIGTARPVRNSAGQQIGAVLTLRDDTKKLAQDAALRAALETKNTLLFEINHRVKNNLQIVDSILSLQRNRINDAAALEAVDDISTRLGVIASLHRTLYETGDHSTVEVMAYLTRLARETAEAFDDNEDLRLDISASGRATMAIDKAVSLALAVNELMLNSFKHAFSETSEPMISLAMTATEDTFHISYRDNGRGDESAEKTEQGVRFGSILIGGLVGQLGATVTRPETDQGYAIDIDAPLSNAPEKFG